MSSINIQEDMVNTSLSIRAHLLSSLVRLGFHVTNRVYEFCDLMISMGWKPPINTCECDHQVLELYGNYMREVKK